MNEASKARPVSGEIMTDAAAPGVGIPVRPAGDVIDAEFETIVPGKAASEAPEPSSTRFSVRAPEIAGLDVLKRAEAPKRGQPGRPAFWAFGLCLVALAFWVSGGHALLPSIHLPAFLASAPSLKITSVHTRIEKIDGHAILFVDGSAANETGRAIDVPPLSISVTGEDGRTTRFFLGTRDRQVAAGEIFAFSSRLEVPKDGVKSVSVSFDR
ncbi:MAG: hypothetical protein L0I29_06010 [Hyphomicrobiales bacterium]|nr:hypothetical protein [Hyphomicrobiales bacterium]